MLRSLKQARYAADPLGHFALAFNNTRISLHLSAAIPI